MTGWFFCQSKLYSCASLLVFVTLLLITGGCGGDASEPTPDVDATVNARLTEAAIDNAAETTASPTTQAQAQGLTSTPTPSATVAPSCTVVTNALNVRQGPATVFDVIDVIPQGTVLTPLATNPDGTFVFVRLESGLEGWVSASAQFIECSIEVAGLPTDAGPPTPTATNTPVTPPTATSTPTRAALVVLPRAGGGDGDLTGDVWTLPELFTGSVDRPVFSDKIFLQVIVFDSKAGKGSVDGAGIRYVDITITDANEDGDAGDKVFYQSREETPAYCSFGGDGPCNILGLGPSARWPGTGIPIDSGLYSLNFAVEPERQDSEGGNWRIVFRIQRPGDPPPETGDLQPIFAQIVETGHADAVTFQVVAYDPNVGNQDGTGIERVVFQIYDPQNVLVYEQVESTAAYCAFGGNGPCNEWRFNENEDRWPGQYGEERVGGAHRLSATVLAKDGREKTVEQVVNISPPNQPPRETNLSVELAELMRDGSLVFEVVAFDSGVGTTNGDGIQKVDLYLYGPDGDEVYRKTENSAAYCTFGGDAPCLGWNLAENDYRWPGGRQFVEGIHRWRAVAHGSNNQTAEISGNVEIRRR